ncbi:MAG: hypothetical protein Q8Q09_00155 [Deltaproteobacteria bacterium]|nr:hypothetical protein [Deltaproteobacteria bacterium]
MTLLTKQSLSELLLPQSGPCLSLYQPTHRQHPENQADPIRFHNLVKELETSLLKAYSAAETWTLLKPFEALAKDQAFWNHALDGLAVLGCGPRFQVFRLPRTVAAFAVVADSFHLKPLWQFLQTVDRYQVLALSLDKVRLFEGDRDVLAEVELADGVPRTITAALGAELSEPHQTVASYGGVGGASNAMHHGHGAKAEEVKIDADRFFRAIDRAVLEHHSGPTELPLILAALPEHHQRFRSVSHNPFLQPEGIMVNPSVLTNEVLRTLAWKLMEPQFDARLAKLTDRFGQAQSAGRGSDNLSHIAEAAAAGRVATLFIEADRQIGGHLGEGNGKVTGAALSSPRVNDVLDDLGELVGKMGGDVVVLPTAKMPTRKGAAAIYRH